MTTIDVSFRLATEADFGPIESLINAGFPDDPPIDREVIASWLAAGGRVIVAVASRGVIGCVRMDPKLKGLFHLVVAPELRGRGFGRQLVAEFEVTARQLGWPYVLLGVDTFTSTLVGYYRDLGYQPTGGMETMFDHAGNAHPVRKLIMMGKILPPG